jgi:hypothetical protein
LLASTPRAPWTVRPASWSAHAGHVVDPLPGGRRDRVEIEGGGLVALLQGLQLDPPGVAGQDRDPDLAVDRDGQHVAQVVVGVLADEVDPARCADDPDRRRVCRGIRLAPGELVPQPGGVGRLGG